MRVVLFSPSADQVGVSTHVINLARLLERLDLLFLVVCPKHGWLSEELQKNGLPHKVIPMGFRWHEFLVSVARYCSFLRAIPHRNQVVVHCHGRFPLFISLLPLLVFRDIRFVATVHQFVKASAPGIANWKDRLEATMLRRVNRVWCVSNALKDEVLTRLGPGHSARIDAIPNWIEPIFDHENANNSPHIAPGTSESEVGLFRVCGVGRLSTEKGFDVLIGAIASMVANGRNVVCDIFGTGIQESNLGALIWQHGLQDRVFLRGSSKLVRWLIQNYHALVIPSRSESFGIVALEAFDARVPVVASDVAGLSEIVVHERTGLTFESGNSQSLATELKRLMGSRELALALVSQARHSLRQFTPTKDLERNVTHFYSLATRSGNAPNRAER